MSEAFYWNPLLGHASCVIKYSEKFSDYTAGGFQGTKPSGTIYSPALSLLPSFALDEMQDLRGPGLIAC